MSQSNPTIYDVGDLEREIARLTASLHANRCHPDYEYRTVPDYVSRPDSEPYLKSIHLDGDGWERNPEFFAMPGHESWRKRKEQG